MTALYNRIKADQLALRKQGNVLDSRALTYLLGELDRYANKDYSDKNVVRIIDSVVKKLKKAHVVAPSESGLRELQKFREYLPKQLTGIELEALICSLTYSTMGEAMRQLKDHPVDMAEAKKLVIASLK